MVHQRDTGEPCLVSGQRNVLQPRRRVIAPREPRQLQDHVEPGVRRRRLRQNRLRRGVGSWSGVVHDVEYAGPALVRQPVEHGSERPQLLGQDASRDRTVAGCVAQPAHFGWSGERHHDARHARGEGQVEVATPPGRVETQRVDDSGEAPAQTAGDDQVQQPEGVRGRVEVVPATADHGAQVVGGDDLGLSVPRLGPGGLTRAGRADQHDKSRVWKRRLTWHDSESRSRSVPFSATRHRRPGSAGVSATK